MPFEGRDNLYVISGGVEGQLAVAAAAPGDRDYNGGQWAFHSVSWNVEPYELTSEEDVVDAEGDGDITVARIPEADFKCPVQPQSVRLTAGAISILFEDKTMQGFPAWFFCRFPDRIFMNGWRFRS